MRLRNRLIQILIGILVLSFAVPALADGEKKKSHEQFGDLKGSEWSVSYIAEMNAKGLMKGTGEGKFEPRAALDRSQAITVVVRLLNLEAEAKALTTVSDEVLPFADREQIPAWAKPYVAVAAKKEIIPVSEDGMLRPHEKATRLWVSVMLVRALGFDAEAQAKMAATLPFKDARQVPAKLVGYVAAAVDHQLVRGFEDVTFRPNQPLTRAEAAALLSRTDGQLVDLGRSRPEAVKGHLIAVDAQAMKLTIKAKGREHQVILASNVAIFVNEKEAALTDLFAGMKVALTLGAEGNASVVSARPTDAADEKEEVKGVITALLPPAEGQSGTGVITLKHEEGGQEKTYSLAAEVEVTGAAHVTLSMADLKVGDLVKVRLVAGVAVAVKVEKGGASPEHKDELKGTVTAVTVATASDLGTITIKTEAGAEVAAKVAPAAEIRMGKHLIGLEKITVGARAELKVIAGVAVRVRIESPESEKEPEEETRGFKGEIVAVTAGSPVTIAIKDQRGQVHILKVAANADLRIGVATLLELLPGTKVEAKVRGEILLGLKVER